MSSDQAGAHNTPPAIPPQLSFPKSCISFWVSQQLPVSPTNSHPRLMCHLSLSPLAAVFHPDCHQTRPVFRPRYMFTCGKLCADVLFFFFLRTSHINKTSGKATWRITADFNCQFQICADGWLYELPPAVRWALVCRPPPVQPHLSASLSPLSSRLPASARFLERNLAVLRS